MTTACIAQRFFAKLSIAGDPCWLWTGAVDSITGYGKVSTGNKVRNAHAVAYELFVGPVPDGLELDHLWPCAALREPAPSRAGHAPRELDARGNARGCALQAHRLWVRAVCVMPALPQAGGVVTPQDRVAGESTVLPRQSVELTASAPDGSPATKPDGADA